MNDHIRQAEELAEFCGRLYRRDYVAATMGNLSVRLPGDRILITPAGLNKGYITSGDMVVCDLDGVKLEGVHQPSSEIRIHLVAYKLRPDVEAVCHAHPVFATAFSLAGKPFDEAMLPELVAELGIIPLVEYATPGSDRLSSNLVAYMERHDAFLLQAHGTLTLGASMMEAFNRTELVEHYARVLFYAGLLGSVPRLSLMEAKYLLELGGRKNLKGDIIGSENK